MPRRNPCSALPRRLQIVASLAVTITLLIVFFASSDSSSASSSSTTSTTTTTTTTANNLEPYLEKVPFGPEIQSNVHNALSNAHHVVDRLSNPFGTSAQDNSGGDGKWRTPFSSDTTRDEERAMLPPPVARPPVYTYLDEKGKITNQDLLLIWRRAWWAMGFQPVVLSRSEATNHPLYRKVQAMELTETVETEVMRWLAWSTMNGGILANVLALPMTSYDDQLLTFLRRGEYPTLTAYKGLDSALYIGEKGEITAALTEALSSPALKRVERLEEALPKDTVQLDAQPEGIAFYNVTTLQARYDLENMSMLPDLITSHLHATWRERFDKGISVIKPLPQKSTALIESAIDIARNLSTCPVSPIPTSCPPNRPRCKPCVSSAMTISTPKVFRNDSRTFTIGVMPHPWTIQSIVKARDTMDLSFVRRKTERDIWIDALTKELLGSGVASHMRLPCLKKAVATEHGNAHSLWLTAEHPTSISDLDWIFGFRIPRSSPPDGKSETPVPGPERRPPKPQPEYGDGPVPSEKVLKNERELFEKAKVWLGKKQNREEKEMRGVMEAWNLADTEGWKFVRAWNARRESERLRWERGGRSGSLEEQERGWLGRWVD